MARLHTLTASELAPLLQSGTLSAQALATACLDRIAQRERTIGAWEYLDPDIVRHQSLLCDRRQAEGQPSAPYTAFPWR